MQNSENNINTTQRILVIMEPHLEIGRLLRSAKRRANKLGCEWEVLHVETPDYKRRLSAHDRQLLLNHCTLAEQMGACVTILQARSQFDGIRQLLAKRSAEHISIISIKLADISPRRYFSFTRPLARKLQALVPEETRIVTVPLGAEMTSTRQLLNVLRVNGEEIFKTILAVSLATLSIEILGYLYPVAIAEQQQNKALIYFLACAYSAGRYGLIAGLVASVASFLALSYIYITPYTSFGIEDPATAFSLGLFLTVGFVLSFFGDKDYVTRIRLARQSDRFQSLLGVHRTTLNQDNVEDAIHVLDRELTGLLEAPVAFFIAQENEAAPLRALSQKEIKLNSADKMALDSCRSENKTTGVGAPFEPEGCEWRFEPLMTVTRDIGVLGVKITNNISIDTDFGRLLAGIADQVALIFERLEYEHVAEANRLQAEKESLRSMLLSSVSHDLKTPLASIIGSLSVFRSMGSKLPEEHRHTLINTALDEAQRLDSFITNILDMTRIESGQIDLRAEWIRPEELVSDVMRRMRDRLHQHPVQILPPQEPVQVMMDGIMTGQILQNLLDNAAKYTPAGTKIEIAWSLENDGFLLTVRDHGAGFPPEQTDKIFDKYARLKRQDNQVAGTGLGLAIARAIILAQDGSITAQNHPDGGAVFALRLPKARTTKERAA